VGHPGCHHRGHYARATLSSVCDGRGQGRGGGGGGVDDADNGCCDGGGGGGRREDAADAVADGRGGGVVDGTIARGTLIKHCTTFNDAFKIYEKLNSTVEGRLM
jgi:hypothetical protein